MQGRVHVPETYRRGPRAAGPRGHYLRCFADSIVRAENKAAVSERASERASPNKSLIKGKQSAGGDLFAPFDSRRCRYARLLLRSVFRAEEGSFGHGYVDSYCERRDMYIYDGVDTFGGFVISVRGSKIFSIIW